MFNVVDVETLQPLKMNVELEFINRSGQLVRENRITPLFLRTNEIWKRVFVKNEDYYKLNVEIPVASEMRFLFVKKKFFHQIDIKEFQNVLMGNNGIFEESKVQKVLKSSYLWAYFQVLLRESGFPDARSPKDKHKNPVSKYLEGIYKLLKKGKSNLLPIFLTYLFGFHGQEKTGSNGSRTFNDKLALNGKMICAFEHFLSALTQKFDKQEKLQI